MLFGVLVFKISIDLIMHVITIVLHSIIYDPQASDNEEKSAKLFETFSTDPEVQLKVCPSLLR